RINAKFILPSYLDHIVITAPTLDAGVHQVEQRLGVTLAAGGAHPRMGTHNRLLRLGDAAYLEVIAPDPAAPRPAWPRWFGLDRLRPDSPPRLAAWVARCDDIHAAAANLADVFGTIQPMTRGDLAWQITIRADGALPLGGAAPSLIEWQAGTHPARQLPDAGCSLAELAVHHPEPERVHGVLASIALQSRPVVGWSGNEPPYLAAPINTPAG